MLYTVFHVHVHVIMYVCSEDIELHVYMYVKFQYITSLL